MDPTYPAIDSTQFPICDWSEFYGDIEEPIPPNAPEAIGKVVDLHMFVASDQQEINIYRGLAVHFWYTLILP